MDLTKFGFTTSKKKKTDDHDDEKKEKKKQYETKRERNFQENWADESVFLIRNQICTGPVTVNLCLPYVVSRKYDQ
jgi:hypothetical protein